MGKEGDAAQKIRTAFSFLAMSNIFISQSHRDVEIAQAIRDYLEPFGASVFIAHVDLRPFAGMARRNRTKLEEL